MKKIFLFLVFMCFLVVFFFGGLSMGESIGGDKVILAKNVKILSEDTMKTLVISEEGDIYAFPWDAEGVYDIEEGDVIVGGLLPETPYGFLRKVTSAFHVMDKIVLETKEATIEDVVEKGKMSFGLELPRQSDFVSARKVKGGIIASFPNEKYNFHYMIYEVVLYDSDGNLETVEDQIRINGELVFNLKLNFYNRIDKRYGINDFGFTIEYSENSWVEFSGDVDLDGFDKKVNVVSNLRFPPILTNFPGIYITPSISVVVGVKGNLSAGMRSGMSSSIVFSGGVNHEGSMGEIIGEVPVAEFSTLGRPSFFMTTKDSSAKAYFVVKAGILIQGITGPSVQVEKYLEAKISPLAIPSWDVSAKINIPFSINAEVLGENIPNYNVSFYDYGVPLARADNVFTDEDGDGYISDCNDFDPKVPGPEFCNGYDDNCNDIIDEGCPPCLPSDLKVKPLGLNNFRITWKVCGNEDRWEVEIRFPVGGGVFDKGVIIPEGTPEKGAMWVDVSLPLEGELEIWIKSINCDGESAQSYLHIAAP